MSMENVVKSNEKFVFSRSSLLAASNSHHEYRSHKLNVREFERSLPFYEEWLNIENILFYRMSATDAYMGTLVNVYFQPI